MADCAMFHGFKVKYMYHFSGQALKQSKMGLVKRQNLSIWGVK